MRSKNKENIDIRYYSDEELEAMDPEKALKLICISEKNEVLRRLFLTQKQIHNYWYKEVDYDLPEGITYNYDVRAKFLKEWKELKSIHTSGDNGYFYEENDYHLYKKGDLLMLYNRSYAEGDGTDHFFTVFKNE